MLFSLFSDGSTGGRFDISFTSSGPLISRFVIIAKISNTEYAVGLFCFPGCRTGCYSA